jgi:predicted nucleic acid-binding protein
VDIFRNRLVDNNIRLLIEGGILCTTPIILCELFKGCYLTNRPEESLVLLKKYITQTQLLDFDATSCSIYGKLSQELLRKGKLTQDQDLMIAAICIAHNVTLITKNKKHFENIPGLKVEYV